MYKSNLKLQKEKEQGLCLSVCMYTHIRIVGSLLSLLSNYVHILKLPIIYHIPSYIYAYIYIFIYIHI